MKVALVYDHANKIGGAERILDELHELYPDAPLFTSVYEPKRAPWAQKFRVETSFLQKLPFAKRYHELYPIAAYIAMEQFTFDDFDVVISVTSAESKAVITGTQTLHICYCLTPTRYLWSHYCDYFNNGVIRALTLPFVVLLRIWDVFISARPDVYIAISETVSHRIKKYYRQLSRVIYPPVDTEKFLPLMGSRNDYYLVVSRLVSYKHIDLAIQACNILKRRLKIVGVGLDRKRLAKLAGPTIQFVGNVTDCELVGLYQNCKALLFVQEEDFGITQVEALACGKPVIAFKKGGASEVQVESVTGEFFENPEVDALIRAIEKFESKQYDPKLLHQRAEKFAKIRFLQEFAKTVKEEWKAFNQF